MKNNSEYTPILPGSCLGILGGGQLGRMACHAAQQMGYRTLVLDPDPQSPAGLIAHQHIQASYNDEAALAVIAKTCQAITIEFENIPTQSLDWLAHSQRVIPKAQCVAITQDRAAEKAHFRRCNVATAPYTLIDDVSALQNPDPGLFPAILKTTRLGYDGKGQQRVDSANALPAAWQALNRQTCILEKRLPLAYEISVIVARAQNGNMVHLPIQHNTHRNGILAYTRVDIQAVPSAIAQQALGATQTIAEQLRYEGVLCVEFFVLQDGSLIANEMAPRPHNSGHYSIDSCSISQFALQIRTLCHLPLSQPVQHSQACMLNLLGDLWQAPREDTNPAPTNNPQTPPWDALLALPGVHLHLYGKAQARPRRKMGHITIAAATTAEVHATANQAAILLGLSAPCQSNQ